MASFIQNSSVNSVGLNQQEFDFPTIGIPKVIPINPDVNGNSTHTRVSSFGWYGAALAVDGNIYAPPYGETTILGINTKTKKAFTIDVPGVSVNGQTYGSFVSHPNGKLYATPMDAAQILEFDPINKKFVAFGGGQIGFGDWIKGIVAPNGFIYCAPGSSDQVLKIDVYNRSVTSFGDTGYTGLGSEAATNDKGGYFFDAAILVGNKIYCIPGYAKTDEENAASPNKRWIVGIIDTTNDTLDMTSFTFGETELAQFDDHAGTTNNGGNSNNASGWLGAFNGAVMGIDGKIYTIPEGYPYICVIDPLTNTISRMSNVPLGTTSGTGSSTVFGRNDRPSGGAVYEPDGELVGGILAANGKIYAYRTGSNPNAPQSNSIIEINTENQSWRSIPLPTTMSDGEVYDNTFWFYTTILGPDGGIYGIPYIDNWSTTSGALGGNITLGDNPCVWMPPSGALPAPWILNSNQNGMF